MLRFLPMQFWSEISCGLTKILLKIQVKENPLLGKALSSFDFLSLMTKHFILHIPPLVYFTACCGVEAT